uniref:Uncharacterized protein n=1 Tax=Arundo donax TaxID=35708 RepID=A0A0A9GZH6_ARUDO
MPPRYGGWP